MIMEQFLISFKKGLNVQTRGDFFSLMVADGGAIRPLTGAQNTNFIIGGYGKSGDRVLLKSWRCNYQPASVVGCIPEVANVAGIETGDLVVGRVWHGLDAVLPSGLVVHFGPGYRKSGFKDIRVQSWDRCLRWRGQCWGCLLQDAPLTEEQYI